MKLEQGDHYEYLGVFDPDATHVVVGIPYGEADVYIEWHGEGYPTTRKIDSRWPDWKWVAKPDKRTIHGNRPWIVKIPEKAIGASIGWRYNPPKNNYDEYAGRVTYKYK